VEYYADYRQWLAHLEKKNVGQKSSSGKQGSSHHDTKGKNQRKKGPGPGRLSYLDQRLYDRMEESILAAEEELERLRKRMADPHIAGDADELQKCWQQHEEAEQKVAALYDTWDELERKKAAGQN